MKKRLLSLLLCLSMAATLLPGTALAAEDSSSPADKSGTLDTGLTWNYKAQIPEGYNHDAGGTLTISGSAAMPNWSITENSVPPWYDSKFKNVVIQDGVTSIGSSAFAGSDAFSNDHLETVEIPSSVTSIGDRAFRKCSKLPSIIIPESVTSIGIFAFQECTALAGIVLPDRVTEISNYTFFKCTGLRTIAWSNGLTKIGTSAFEGCTSLEAAPLNEGITEIGKTAFMGCTSLTDITIPSTLQTIGAWAFGDCTGLTRVKISDGVTTLGNSMFYGCTSLAKVTIPASVTTLPLGAFSNCTELKDVYYAGTQTQWETLISENNTDFNNVTVHYGEEDPGNPNPDTPDVPDNPAAPQIAFSQDAGGSGMPYTYYQSYGSRPSIELRIKLLPENGNASFAVQNTNEWAVDPENFVVKYNGITLDASSRSYHLYPATSGTNVKALMLLIDAAEAGTVSVQAKAAAFTGTAAADSNVITQDIALPALPQNVAFGALEESTGIPTSIQWTLSEGTKPAADDLVAVQITKYPYESEGTHAFIFPAQVTENNGTYTVNIADDADSERDAYDWFKTEGNLRDGSYEVGINFSRPGADGGLNYNAYSRTVHRPSLQGSGRQSDALVYDISGVPGASYAAGSAFRINVQTVNCKFDPINAGNPSNWTVAFDGAAVAPEVYAEDKGEQAYISFYIPPTTAAGQKTVTVTPKAAVLEGTAAQERINAFSSTVAVTAFAAPDLYAYDLDSGEDVTIKAGQNRVEIVINAGEVQFDKTGAADLGNWEITGDSGLTLASVEHGRGNYVYLLFTGSAVGGKALTIAAKPAAFGVGSGENAVVSILISTEAVTPVIRANSGCEIGDTESYLRVECTNMDFGAGAANPENWEFNAGTTGLTVESITFGEDENGNQVKNELHFRLLAAEGGAKGGTLSLAAKQGAFGAGLTAGSNTVEIKVEAVVARPRNIQYTFSAAGRPDGLTWTWTRSGDTVFPTLRSISLWLVGDGYDEQVYREDIHEDRLTIAPGDTTATGTYTYTYRMSRNLDSLSAGTYCLVIDYSFGENGRGSNPGPDWTVSSGGSTGGNTGGSTGGSSSGGGGGSSSNTSTSTTKNPDGSTTTKTENKSTGTVTETTKNPDGSQVKVETKKDGTVTTTETDKAGNKTETVEKPDGSSVTKVAQKDGTTATVSTDASGQVEAEVALPKAAVNAAQSGGEAVPLPIPEVRATKNTGTAPAVTVKTGSSQPVKVEIPTANTTPGTVAVIVKADGSEEVVKTSVPTENGVAVSLPDGATVKIVDNGKNFADVPMSSWAADAVSFSSARELFGGTSENTFSPEAPMTRAMMVTVLARFDGEDTSGGTNWYQKGMDWAVAKGVSNGSNPNGSITREQLATMLWRYSGSPVSSGTLDGFTDASQVSDYAQEAMRWAVENGIISGYGNGQLGPRGNATRAQVAQMLKNFIEK